MAIIKDNIITLLQFRIEQEEMSSRLYKSMSVWLEYNGYSGASLLWDKYASEELCHANWAYKYLLDLDIQPQVLFLQRPKDDFKSLPQIIALSYDHEKTITSQCQMLAKKCSDEDDYMTLELAQRYLKEQVDELAKSQYWINRLEAFGDSKEALFLLDNEMGK